MSELRAATISNTAGTGPVELTGQVASKSWINFDGTGTVSIRESFDVSSITDNGTGNYTVNFATALTDANYAVVGTRSRFDPNSTVTLDEDTPQTASGFRVLTGTGGSSTPSDPERVHLIVVR